MSAPEELMGKNYKVVQDGMWWEGEEKFTECVYYELNIFNEFLIKGE